MITVIQVMTPTNKVQKINSSDGFFHLAQGLQLKSSHSANNGAFTVILIHAHCPCQINQIKIKMMNLDVTFRVKNI